GWRANRFYGEDEAGIVRLCGAAEERHAGREEYHKNRTLKTFEAAPHRFSMDSSHMKINGCLLSRRSAGVLNRSKLHGNGPRLSRAAVRRVRTGPAERCL